MNATDSLPVGPVRIPSTFPVTWEAPDDADLTWIFDRMHWPAQVTPMTGQYIDIFLQSADPMFATFEIPARMRSRRINTYHYHATIPLPVAEEELAERMRRVETRLNEALHHLDEQWANSYLPTIKASLAFWRDLDCATATLPALLAHLDATLDHVRRLSTIHHEVQMLAALAPSLFQDLFAELFGAGDASDGEQASEAYQLLRGFDNQTLAATRALWRLSRHARAIPPVYRVVREYAASSVMRELERMPEAQPFLAELQRYLEAYGQRSASVLDLAAPTWLDDPTPVIRDLQGFVLQPERDMDAAGAALVAERERLVTQARQRVSGFPTSVVDQFHFLLKAAQTGVFLSEEHHYWIDCCMTHAVRHVMLEFGRRLSATGILAAADDVFYLRFDEVRAAVEAQHDWRRVVAERRAEMECFRAIPPPPFLGSEPGAPVADDPLSRSDLRFWGAPPPHSASPDLLYGHAGSPGVARGPARVVRSLAEAQTVQPGDILVVETTLPPWTPLFAIAAGVVTDTGGVLSHAALVAREYGIPAVVGTGMATRVIPDGRLVEVDGSTGCVRMLATV